MKDPLIRSYHETPPAIPDLDFVRFRWPDRHDDDVRRIRERVQDGGKGLYVLIDPRDPFGVKTLVEAYYPEDINPEYAKPDRVVIDSDYGVREVVTMSDHLNPHQHADFRSGRLTAVGFIHERGPDGKHIKDANGQKIPVKWAGDLDNRQITNIRKGNANARKDLRRQVSKHVRKQNMRRKAEKEQAKRDEEFLSIGDRFDEEVEKVMKPHIYTS